MTISSHRGINVLLVNPTFTQYTHGWPPLGLAYLGAALIRAGHRVQVFDPTPTNPDGTLIKKGFRPDLVGITVLSPFRLAARMIAERVHSETGIPVAVGGPDVTGSWEQHISDPAVDYAVIGEAEKTIVELAECVAEGRPPEGVAGLNYKRDGEVVVNPPRALMQDADDAPLPDRGLLDMEWYARQVIIRGTAKNSTTIMSARGCPRACVFCDSRRTWTRAYRPHSAGRVVEEMRQVRDRYQVNGFQFLDDTFPVNKKRTLELCERFARELPGIEWSCQARVGGLDDELVLAMKEGGCIQLEFGVESGSQRVLDFLNKGFTVEQVRQTFAMCRNHGVRTYANLMIGTPHETVDDVRATFDLYREIRPNASDMWTATPYPGTDLYEYCRKNGLLAADYDVGMLHHGHELGDNYVINSVLRQQDVRKLLIAFYHKLRQNWDF